MALRRPLSQEPSQANLIRLQRAVEPPRQELFRRLNMAPGGMALLVEMRRRLLSGLPSIPTGWGSIPISRTCSVRGSTAAFFPCSGSTGARSALVLEKLIKYEAVHPIQGWHDLRRRLEADRRCYAFFHPALPDEPVIFIEVALTRGISTRCSRCSTRTPRSRTRRPPTARSSTRSPTASEGLRGVSFGNLLIKQVAEDLGRELPRLKTFATLSPIPGFRTGSRAPEKSYDGPERAALASRLTGLQRAVVRGRGALRAQRQDLRRWAPTTCCTPKQAQDPLDPVARFHLGNGARLERLNWLADTSAVGLRHSAGMMVNYVYRLDEVERNHEAYARERKIVASRHLQQLAKRSLLAQGSRSGAPKAAPAATQAIATESSPRD